MHGSERRWDQGREEHGENAVEVARSRSYGDQREHVQLAVENRLPAADKEWPSAPEHHDARKRELQPERVLQRVTRKELGDHECQDRQRKSETDPETPRHAVEFRAAFICGRYFHWLQIHTALRTASRAELPDLGMHRAGILREPAFHLLRPGDRRRF